MAVVVALAAGTWWLLIKDTRGAEIATVLALSVAVLSLLVTVVVGWPAAPETMRLLSVARRLAGEVRAQEGEVLARLLADIGDPQPAEVRFAQPELLYW